MASLIVTPDLPKVLIRRQGIFTVPDDLGALECKCPRALGPCGGIDIEAIPLQYRAFQLTVKRFGERFIARQKPRGYEWHGGYLELHGPWPSLDLSNTAQDASAPSWNEVGQREKDGLEHPEKAAANVIERKPGLLDYILVGDFLFQDKPSDLEVPE